MLIYIHYFSFITKKWYYIINNFFYLIYSIIIWILLFQFHKIFAISFLAFEKHTEDSISCPDNVNGIYFSILFITSIYFSSVDEIYSTTIVFCFIGSDTRSKHSLNIRIVSNSFFTENVIGISSVICSWLYDASISINRFLLNNKW